MPPLTIPFPELKPDQQAYLENIKRNSRPPTEKEKKNFLIPGPNFDPNLSPRAFVNRASARVRGWTFDHGKQQYRDKDGSIIADKFGQLL